MISTKMTSKLYLLKSGLVLHSGAITSSTIKSSQIKQNRNRLTSKNRSRYTLASKIPELEISETRQSVEDDAFNAFKYLQKRLSSSTKKDWTKLKDEIIGLPLDGSKKLVNKSNVEQVIWQNIFATGNIKNGIDFYNARDEKQKAVNTSVNFLYLLIDASQEDIKQYDKFVVDFCEVYLKEVDYISMRNRFWLAICLLAKTSQWRRAINCVNNVNRSGIPQNADKASNENLRGKSLTILVENCMREDNMDLVWKLMDTQIFFENDDILTTNLSKKELVEYDKLFKLFANYLHKIREKDRAEETKVTIKLLKSLQKNLLFISHNTADMLTELFGKHRAKISQIRNSVEKDVGKMKLVDYLGTDGLSGSSKQQVDRQGQCYQCGYDLDKFFLSDDERLKIIDILKNSIMKRKDINDYSNKAEFDLFFQFLDSKMLQKKFDLIVDGPNVHYQQISRRFYNEKEASRMRDLNLFQTVEMFSKLRRNILLIHKAEFHKCTTFEDIKNLPGVSVFTVSNTTKDDLFLILAGLLHGPDCDILTSDYLRQHRYALECESLHLAKVFLRWKLARNISIEEFRGYKYAKTLSHVKHCDPKFIWPQIFVHHCHQSRDSNHWHIPIRPTGSHNGFYTPTQWLCLDMNDQSMINDVDGEKIT